MDYVLATSITLNQNENGI